MPKKKSKYYFNLVVTSDGETQFNADIKADASNEANLAKMLVHGNNIISECLKNMHGFPSTVKLNIKKLNDSNKK
jgi:hypothetical protein